MLKYNRLSQLINFPTYRAPPGRWLHLLLQPACCSLSSFWPHFHHYRNPNPPATHDSSDATRVKVSPPHQTSYTFHILSHIPAVPALGFVWTTQCLFLLDSRGQAISHLHHASRCLPDCLGIKNTVEINANLVSSLLYKVPPRCVLKYM